MPCGDAARIVSGLLPVDDVLFVFHLRNRFKLVDVQQGLGRGNVTRKSRTVFPNSGAVTRVRLSEGPMISFTLSNPSPLPLREFGQPDALGQPPVEDRLDQYPAPAGSWNARAE